jgi:chromosome segregation ATPase
MPETTSLDHIREMLKAQGREAALRVEGLRSELSARFDAVDDKGEALLKRCDAIDEKQRIANGRVSKMEGSLERVDERIGQLTKVDGDHGAQIDDINKRLRVHRRGTDSAAVTRVHSRSTDGRWLSERDVKIVGLTIVAVFVVLAFLIKLGVAPPAIQRAIQ